MTQKFSYDLERNEILDWHINELREFMIYLSYSDSGIPRKLVTELKNYAKRNSLALDSHLIRNKAEVHICCPNCFKAHALSKLKEFGFDSDIKELIEESFSCDTGHLGYYMDKDKIKRIN